MKSFYVFTQYRIVLSVKVAALLLVTLALYHQDLLVLGNEATKNELMSYLLIMPFLLGYLLYRKRKMLRAVIPLKDPMPKGRIITIGEIIGVMLCLTAFLLYWYGSYTFYPLEYHMLSFPLFIAGCILVAFNTRTLKVLGFPIVFLLFLAPLPPEIVYFLGSTLSSFSSNVGYEILKAIGLPVQLAVQYGTPTIILDKPASSPLVFAIDIACAGIYSLVSFAIFATFVAYVARGPLKKKAAVFLAGFPLLYGLNVIRIISVVLIGYQYGIEAAMQVFHLLGGWILIFIGTIILLAISEKVLKIQLFTNTRKITRCRHCNEKQSRIQRFCIACGKLKNPLTIKLSKRDIGKIVVLTLSSILLINLQVPAFALTEGPAQVTIQTLGSEKSVTQILPETSQYTVKFVYRDTEFEEIARQDASLTYAFVPVDTSQENIWVTLEIAETKATLHPWEACLITYRILAPPVIKLDQKDIQLLQNPPLVGRYFAFRDTQTNVVQVVLYWFETALFNTGSRVEEKHVKISLITFADSPEDINDAEDELIPFGTAIASYWQPIKEWSPISLAIGKVALGISSYGHIILAAVASLLAGMLTSNFMKKRKTERSNFQAYTKLALKEETQIMKAVDQAAKKGKSTSNAIALHYRKLSGKRIELSALNEKLEKAREAGLVKREMSSREDEPVLVWKSLIRFP